MMNAKSVRAAIVGAGSLLGKELTEVLNEPGSQLWELSLFDAGDAGGQLTSAGDEALVIQPLESTTFAGMDIVFFAGDEQTTLNHWQAAVKAGAGVVDLTGALSEQPNVAVHSAWVKRDAGQSTLAFDLATVAVVSAHPAALMLGVVLSRLDQQFGLQRATATLLQPASALGGAGLDELHAQTVSLLSFQELRKTVSDTQIAFNLTPAFGNEAKVDLQMIAAKIREDLSKTVGESTASRTTFQLIQAPVFSGFGASLHVELNSQADAEAVEKSLNGGIVSVPNPDEPSPSNQVAAEEGKLLLQVRAEPGNAFWIWMAADNLRLAARNAVGCAQELLAFRPGSKLQ